MPSIVFMFSSNKRRNIFSSQDDNTEIVHHLAQLTNHQHKFRPHITSKTNSSNANTIKKEGQRNYDICSSTGKCKDCTWALVKNIKTSSYLHDREQYNNITVNAFNSLGQGTLKTIVSSFNKDRFQILITPNSWNKQSVISPSLRIDQSMQLKGNPKYNQLGSSMY